MVRYFSALITMILILGILSGCNTEMPPETTAPTEDPKLLVTQMVCVVESDADLKQLEAYPNLVSLDLRGSVCYDAILSYVARNPHITVTYDITIGDYAYDPGMKILGLEDGSFTFQELIQCLQYFTSLTELNLPGTTLTGNELRELRDTYPQINLCYSVYLGDEEIPGDTTQINLSHLDSEHIDEAVEVLPRLIDLKSVHLSDEEGKSNLEVADVKMVMDVLHTADVYYSFNLFGKKVSTMDERVEYVKKSIGDGGVEQIRQALDIMPRCTYLLLDRCGISNSVMADLQNDYPDKKIVWRIYYANSNCLTDITVFRCVEQLNNGNSKQLKYCKDIVYMDIGHSYNLSDLSFVSYMPNLKVAIIADCYTDSLEPFSACKNLEWIEIVNCVRLKDITPLAECTNLRGVNMSYSFSIDDLSPLYGLEHLERLFLGRHDLPQETVDEAKAALPNCWVTDKSWNVAWIGFNYSIGWRLDDEHTFAEWYQEIKEVFGYTRGI